MKRILFIFAQVILLIIVAVFATGMNRMDQRLPSAHAESISFLDEPMRPAHVFEYAVYIDGIEITVYPYPLHVLVIAHGWLGYCDTYMGYTQSRDGFTFDVSLTAEPPSGGGCNTGQYEFQEWIDLDLVGAEPGNYTVNVNGITGTFVLPGPPTPTVTGTPPTATPTSIPTNTPTSTSTPTFTPTPVPDFTLSVSPTSRSVGRLGTTTYTVNLMANSSYNGSVSLTVSGLPDRIDHSFSPNPVALTPGGSRSSVLTISTRRNTSAGTYTLTITGTEGVRTRSQTIALIVNR